MAADDTFDFDDTLAQAPTAPVEAGVVGGRYRLGAVLGRGGGGVVWAAHDPMTGQAVAIKEVVVASAAGAVRLSRELTALRRLNLPGVVRILDDLRWQGWHFIVMERVEGRPFPGEVGPGWAGLAAPFLRLLQVVGQVHRAGLVHRDLKPANVLVREDGQPVLLDFGLARGAMLSSTVTAQDAVVGTPPPGWPQSSSTTAPSAPGPISTPSG